MTPGLFRLILALIVVVHHSTPIRLGTWAVGLFFCLSGYWIAEMWGRKYKKLDRPYLEFLVSRWWRLAPVLFAVTALAGVCIGQGWTDGDVRPLHRWTWWATQPAIAGSTAAGRLLPPAWSLDVEMQFYLVAPLLVAAVGRLPRGVTAGLIALALAWCWVATAVGWAGESARLDVWAGVFLLGVAASVGRWHWPRVAVAASVALTVAALVAAAAVPVTRPWIILRGATGHPMTGTPAAILNLSTILLAIPFALATTGVRSGRVDRFLGDLSYPLYMFHWLPRDWYYARLGAHPHPATAVALLGANVLASVAGAVILLVVIDRPSQRLRARWVSSHAKVAAPDLPAYAGTV